MLKASIALTAAPDPVASAVFSAEISPAFSARTEIAPSAFSWLPSMSIAAEDRIAFVATTPVSAKDAPSAGSASSSASGCIPETFADKVLAMPAEIRRSPSAVSVPFLMSTETALNISLRATIPPRAGPPSLATSIDRRAVISDLSSATRASPPDAVRLASASTAISVRLLIRLLASTKPAPSPAPPAATELSISAVSLACRRDAISRSPPAVIRLLSISTRVNSGLGVPSTSLPSRASIAPAKIFPGSQPSVLMASMTPAAKFSLLSTPPEICAVILASICARIDAAPRATISAASSNTATSAVI